SFLGDMLTTLFERRRAPQASGDDRSLEEMCHALLAAEGEVSGLTLAQAILTRYARLSTAEKHRFFTFLNTDLDIDMEALSTAITQYRGGGELADYRAIATLAEPQRQELLRRLNQSPGATQALVNMRTDLLAAVKVDADLTRTDLDFQHLLRSWFNRGFLVLSQISWETPASILEKIVAYEAVHAIGDWDDLRRRIYPEDRRCFAYFHPSMPDEPLIFVEVALTRDVPNSIQDVLADEREHRDAQETKVAVFYSISNCQEGLKGISFGNLLIKQVVAELQQELPGLETFVTLSPIPRLRSWLERNPEDPRAAILDGMADPADIRTAAAEYLLTAKTDTGAPFDPVARFHLGNGAQVYAVHGAADLSENGLQQSCGAMVNYQYDLGLIEQNHERYVQHNEVSVGQAFRSEFVPAAARRRRTPA
ncbi:MAG: malonyl-CoA decarboxylase, partial [Pseudomonadota bacterium]